MLINDGTAERINNAAEDHHCIPSIMINDVIHGVLHTSYRVQSPESRLQHMYAGPLKSNFVIPVLGMVGQGASSSCQAVPRSHESIYYN